MAKWTIEHDNDTGLYDEGYWEWWTVSDGTKSFKVDNEDDAHWLLDTLNDYTNTEKGTDNEKERQTETRSQPQETQQDREGRPDPHIRRP